MDALLGKDIAINEVYKARKAFLHVLTRALALTPIALPTVMRGPCCHAVPCGGIAIPSTSM